MSQMAIVEILEDGEVLEVDVDNTEDALEIYVETPVSVEEVELNDYIELPDSWISVRTATINPQFTMAGPLLVKVGTAKYPIPAGVWRITSIIATLAVAGTTQQIIADVNINSATIFSGAKITVAPGSTNPAVGSWDASTTYTLGDYLTCDVDQVGSGASAGDTLVISIVLERTN